MARPRKFDETRVLLAARDQFWGAGYAGTSLDDLTVATGLGRGSLYGAFGDKRELFRRALDGYCDDALDNARAQLHGPGSAYHRLVGCLRETAAAVLADDLHRGCLMAKSAAELGGSDDAVRERLGRFFGELHTALAECIAEAQRDGDLDPAAGAQGVASLLLAVLRGLEALGAGGVGPAIITGAAEQLLAVLPTARAPRSR